MAGEWPRPSTGAPPLPTPFAAPSSGPLDEPPPRGVPAPAPAGSLAGGFWPVPFLLAVDDGSARLRIPVVRGTTVHAVVASEVRAVAGSMVELQDGDGRRFRLGPVTNVAVTHGARVDAGAVLGTVDNGDALELAVREADGRWVAPYPLLVGLADPNELGFDPTTGAAVDPETASTPEAMVGLSVDESRAPETAAAPSPDQVPEPVTPEPE